MFTEAALAAACCGGGFAAPALIAGDDKATLTAGYLYSSITKDVYADGIWNKRTYHENFETLRLEGAHIFRDRFQAGISLPMVKRTREAESSSGAGDLSATLGYEYLPDLGLQSVAAEGSGLLAADRAHGTLRIRERIALPARCARPGILGPRRRNFTYENFRQVGCVYEL